MKKTLIFLAFILAGCAAAPSSKIAPTDTDPRINAARDMIVGTWSSVDDRNFQRTYGNDTIVTDSYASGSGETITEAHWALFTAESGEQADFPMDDSVVYIKQTEKDGTSMYFGIASLTDTELTLTNIGQGGMLSFGKMTTGHEMADGQEDDANVAFGNPFRMTCSDKSTFTAVFPVGRADFVTIKMGEENETKMYSGMSGSGIQYGNERWEILFKGETASVLDKMSGELKFCQQPFDSENAPMNFGD